jgi:hypothetical protein
MCDENRLSTVSSDGNTALSGTGRRRARHAGWLRAPALATHRTRVAFQDDRTNTNLLQLAGNIVVRYTWDDARVRHAHVAAQILYAGNFSNTHSGPSSARR